MDISSVVDSLNGLFKDKSSRVMVFWYDENQEFLEDIEDIRLSDACVFVLNPEESIRSKYYFEVEKPDTNFLVYAPFSQPSDSVNYFADMVHYGEVFTADRINIICRDIGVPLNFKSVVSGFSKFWNSRKRVESFKGLGLDYSSEDNIVLGVLSVLVNADFPKFDKVLVKVLIENLNGEGNKFIEAFFKFNVLDEFWSLCNRFYGYSDISPSCDKFLISLFLTYTSSKFSAKIPSVWAKFILTGNDSIVFVNSFMNNVNYLKDFNCLSKKVEGEINLRDSLKHYSVEDYFKCDTFALFDELIINHSVDLLLSNRVKLPYGDLLGGRGTTHFYPTYECSYLMIKWADKLISEIPYLNDLVEPETVEDMISEYVNHWCRIDKYYRKFISYYDQILDKTVGMEDLMELVDNIYTNSFLEKVNPWWVNKLNGLSNLRDISVDKQYNFYKNSIRPSIRQHKTVVIISDALRFNIAQELKEEISKDPTRKVDIEPLMGVIPTYTPLGMASLLPYKTIDYTNEGNVLVDGLNTQGTENRNKILNNYTNNALAISYNELKSLKSKDLNDKLKGVELVYVYHNHIDATGDKDTTENQVFNAAEETIKELKDLITRLTNSANFTNYIVTADHGFIYKRSKITESEKIELNNPDCIIKNKRFLLTNQSLNLASTNTYSLNYIGMDDYYVTVPVGVDIFKVPGSGVNYVHGGASLQESIIPLVNIKSRKGGKNQSHVDLDLISSNKRVTNHTFMLTFIQKENISNTVLPVEVRLYFTDSNGLKISNEVIINANKNTVNAADREFMKEFTLLSSKKYDKSKSYYLVMENIENSVELHKYEFTIDLPFDDGFTF